MCFAYTESIKVTSRQAFSMDYTILKKKSVKISRSQVGFTGQVFREIAQAEEVCSIYKQKLGS